MTSVPMSVKAIYNACCGTAGKAKELLLTKDNKTAHVTVLFEYRKNEFAEGSATIDETNHLTIEASPDVMFDGIVDSGEAFVAAEESAACAFCEKLGVCNKKKARRLIDAYVESSRS